MANYNLVVDSTFQPFSFERYIQPYQLYDKAYKEVEKDYTDYINKVGVWENLINQETEAEAYNQYKNYIDALEENARLLMQEGLNPTQRNNLLGMKSRYSKEIVPIEQAYAKREAQIEAQQKLRAQDPSLLLEGEASVTSLNDYLKNPQLIYKTHSGAVLEQTASKAAGNLAKEMRTNPRKWQGILGDSYYETIMQHGLSSQDILNFMNNPKASKELDDIYTNILESSGIKNWANYEDIKDKVDEHITRGFWSAIGTTSFDRLANPFLDKSGSKKEKTPPELTLSYVTTGTSAISPEFEEKQEILKGLRVTDDIKGYSTETINNLYEKYNSLVQELNSLGTSEELEKFFTKQEKLKKAGVNVVNPLSDRKYHRYTILQKDIKKVKTELQEYTQQLEKYASDWEHLGNNTYEQLNRGLQLEKSQSQQPERTVTFNAESADHKKVIDGVDTIIRSFRKQDIENGNVGLSKVTEKGDQKEVSFEDVQKVLTEPHEIVVRLTNDPHLAIISQGEEYKIKGSNIVDTANNTLKITNEFLSDFSKKGLQQLIGKDKNISDIDVITPEEFQSIVVGATIPKSYLNPIKGGFKGSVFRINDTNEYVKIITDNSGTIIASNTIIDEIEGAGANRLSILLDMAGNINKNYLKQVAVDYDDHK